MDSPARSLHALELGRISEGLRKILAEARAGALDRPWLRPLFHSLILLPLALVLGIWAREHATSEAIREHERTHLPTTASWRELVKMKGFIEVTPALEDAESRRRLRPLRASGAPRGESWITEDRRWIAVMDDLGVPLLFERDDRCRKDRVAEEKPGPRKTTKRSRSALKDSPPRLRVLRTPGRRAKPSNVRWEPLGSGWSAVERVLERVLERTSTALGSFSPCSELGRSAGQTAQEAPEGRALSEGRDPRELRF
jgi:hypothetical protein